MFNLEQGINSLNGNDKLVISEDKNGYDKYFETEKTNFGHGTLIIRHTDYQNSKNKPTIYTDYLVAKVATNADTEVELFEEGDYEIALDYEIKNDGLLFIDSYTNYRIFFRFSVRNGNCMIYPFDVKTKGELTNSSITENGFYLDLAKSRYLNINIKKEVLTEGADGLTEDTRFNRPCKDGDKYTEDNVYSNIIKELDNDSFFVENVSAIYVSKEYLDEVAYNSQMNIYFGYTLSEIEEQFQGTNFIFTFGEDGQTVVQEFEKIDDTFDNVVRNIAIGTGVILLCVTVSAVTAGVGAPAAISVIFAASAKSATTFAISSGLFSGVTAGVVTGMQTKNFDEALKAAALAASEEFMWGSITGAVSGVNEAIALKGATLNGLSKNEAAIIQRGSKLALTFVKNFKSVNEYYIYLKAGLFPTIINGEAALVRHIELDYIDKSGITNAQRITEGLYPLDENGIEYELHLIGQKVDSPIAILTAAEHTQDGNNTILHKTGITIEVCASGTNWEAQVRAFWGDYLKQAQGGY